MLNSVKGLQAELYGNLWLIDCIRSRCRFYQLNNDNNATIEKHVPKCPRVQYLQESGDISLIHSHTTEGKSKYVIIVHNQMDDHDIPYDNGGHPMNFGDK